MQGTVEPLGDLLASSVNEAGAPVGIAQHIRPEGQPMFRVGLVVGQQSINQLDAFVGRAVDHEGLQFIHRRQCPHQIQPNPAGKSTIIGLLQLGRHLLLLPIRANQPVNRVLFRLARGQFHFARCHRRAGPLGEAKPFRPC